MSEHQRNPLIFCDNGEVYPRDRSDMLLMEYCALYNAYLRRRIASGRLSLEGQRRPTNPLRRNLLGEWYVLTGRTSTRAEEAFYKPLVRWCAMKRVEMREQRELSNAVKQEPEPNGK